MLYSHYSLWLCMNIPYFHLERAFIAVRRGRKGGKVSTFDFFRSRPLRVFRISCRNTCSSMWKDRLFPSAHADRKQRKITGKCMSRSARRNQRAMVGSEFMPAWPRSIQEFSQNRQRWIHTVDSMILGCKVVVAHTHVLQDNVQSLTQAARQDSDASNISASEEQEEQTAGPGP